MLDALRACNISDPVVVAGYRAEMVAQKARTVVNAQYASSNMVESLFCARHLFSPKDDLLICYGDIVVEPRVLATVLADKAPVSVAVNRCWRELWAQRMTDPLLDAETLRVDVDGRLLEIGRKPIGYERIQAQYMGLIKVRADSVGRLLHTYDALPRDARYDGNDFSNMHMTSFLQYLIDAGWHLAAVPIDGGWLEVDSVADLQLYEKLESSGKLWAYCRLGASAAAGNGMPAKS